MEYSHGIIYWNIVMEYSHGIIYWNIITMHGPMNIKKKDEILSSENPTVIENLEDQGLNGRVILKWDTKK
jgi:hypothetical protein